MTPQEWLADFLEQGSTGSGGPEQGQPEADSELAAAQSLRERLAEADTWAAPPDGLLDRILGDIEGERLVLAGLEEAPAPVAPPVAAGPAADRSAARVDRLADRRRSRVRRLIGAGTAAIALAAAVVIGFAVTSGPATTDIAMSGTRLAPTAHATAKIHSTGSGLAIVLDVRGLPPSAPGFFYQAWMKGPKGLVTIGTFHMRSGPGTVDLWSAVNLSDYPTLTVTREPEDGNPASSGQVVLTNHP